ncbi:MAG: hypothetical protein Q9202_006876 [Teloschistes flavicans]
MPPKRTSSGTGPYTRYINGKRQRLHYKGMANRCRSPDATETGSPLQRTELENLFNSLNERFEKMKSNARADISDAQKLVNMCQRGITKCSLPGDTLRDRFNGLLRALKDMITQLKSSKNDTRHQALPLRLAPTTLNNDQSVDTRHNPLAGSKETRVPQVDEATVPPRDDQPAEARDNSATGSEDTRLPELDDDTVLPPHDQPVDTPHNSSAAGSKETRLPQSGTTTVLPPHDQPAETRHDPPAAGSKETRLPQSGNAAILPPHAQPVDTPHNPTAGSRETALSRPPSANHSEVTAFFPDPEQPRLFKAHVRDEAHQVRGSKFAEFNTLHRVILDAFRNCLGHLARRSLPRPFPGLPSAVCFAYITAYVFVPSFLVKRTFYARDALLRTADILHRLHPEIHTGVQGSIKFRASFCYMIHWAFGDDSLPYVLQRFCLCRDGLPQGKKKESLFGYLPGESGEVLEALVKHKEPATGFREPFDPTNIEDSWKRQEWNFIYDQVLNAAFELAYRGGEQPMTVTIADVLQRRCKRVQREPRYCDTSILLVSRRHSSVTRVNARTREGLGHANCQIIRRAVEVYPINNQLADCRGIDFCQPAIKFPFQLTDLPFEPLPEKMEKVNQTFEAILNEFEQFPNTSLTIVCHGITGVSINLHEWCRFQREVMAVRFPTNSLFFLFMERPENLDAITKDMKEKKQSRVGLRKAWKPCAGEEAVYEEGKPIRLHKFAVFSLIDLVNGFLCGPDSPAIEHLLACFRQAFLGRASGSTAKFDGAWRNLTEDPNTMDHFDMTSLSARKSLKLTEIMDLAISDLP